MGWLFTSHGQSIGASASASVLPMNIQDWFPVELTGLSSLLSNGLSRVFSSTTVWKYQFFSPQASLWSNSHMTTGKTIVWLYRPLSVKWCLCFSIHCLGFSLLFFQGAKAFNFMSAVTVCSDFGVQENKIFHCFHFPPIYLPWNDGSRCHDLSFLNVEF